MTDAAELEVLDDGRGPGVGGDDGSGLRGLQERVARLRGQLDAGPAPGGGFRLHVRLPVRSDMIRVLIAEDQAMVRGALASLLSLEDDIDVVAQVDRGDVVVDMARSLRPTWPCWTSRCPGSTGCRVAELLARELPSCRAADPHDVLPARATCGGRWPAGRPATC